MLLLGFKISAFVEAEKIEIKNNTLNIICSLLNIF
jgi:hypothetical protein